VKYQPPYGLSDPNAPYINGNPALGQQGSIPPAAAFEQPQREIVGTIEKSGFVTSDIDLLQLAKGIRSQRLNYAVDTGQPNNIVAAFDPPFLQPTNPYTLGLTLHIRIRFTTINVGDDVDPSGLTSLNAGAGNVRVRRMNGADLNPGDLPQGAIATFIYDGTGFQLSNFGGAGGGDNTQTFINIPYTNDISPSPGTIRADFDPPILVPPTAGDIFAVKVAHTAPGATVMIINGLAPIPLLPNGGGIMLQGDIAANDVVQFFYDGSDLRFAPNPEITAPVIYTVGLPPNSQHFDTIDAAMTALKRKTIGANGFVTLKIAPTGVDGGGQPTPIMGPIDVAHPSGDRLAIEGTMIGSPPVPGEFRKDGNSAAQRASDSIYNIAMLRAKYGTEIRIPPLGYAIQNSGAGLVQFRDLLIVGDQLPMAPAQVWWDQTGVNVNTGLGINLTNVTVWGAQVAFNSGGGLYATNCYATWCSHAGFVSAGSSQWLTDCGAFGNQNFGVVATFGSTWMYRGSAEQNQFNGVSVDSSSGAVLWWTNSLNNGLDLVASTSSALTVVQADQAGGGGGNFNTSSPPANTVGNLNSVVATVMIPQPP
jgi:hypothetical protein